MKKKIAVFLGLALIVAVIIGAVIKSSSESVVEVKTAEAKTMEYEDKVLATGTVEVVDSVDVASTLTLPAKLTLKVEEGDQVKQGQVIAELDVSEQKQQLKSAEDNLDAAEKALANAKKANQEIAAAKKDAEKNLALAQQELEAVKALIQEGKAGQQELIEAQQAVAAAQQAKNTIEMQAKAMDTSTLELQVEQARAAVDAARSAVEKGKIKSPIDGVVLQITAKSGSYVQPGMPLITVGKPEQLQVVAKLSEQDINGVKVGQEVEVRWAGAPEQVVKGEVSRIAPVVSAPEIGQTETHIKVYITIDDGAALKPGATVDVVIYRVKPRQSLLVPNEAIIEDGETKTVFVVDNGTAKKVTVQTGHSNELYTEINEGIKANTRVILEPKEIKDGQKVRLTGGGAQ
ncbi:MAG: efflux RND transporter periplasmic adaptor subunit [Thermacetogeniaceae bacterium]|nr:efflux RND transporter periplasmic adaptor subunit [Syntrophomonadaceae bacterium]